MQNRNMFMISCIMSRVCNILSECKYLTNYATVLKPLEGVHDLWRDTIIKANYCEATIVINIITNAI